MLSEGLRLGSFVAYLLKSQIKKSYFNEILKSFLCAYKKKIDNLVTSLVRSSWLLYYLQIFSLFDLNFF